jgi:glycosyltransferase involved in cell wall biosynthesis
VLAINTMINVLYLTNNAGRASTTVATRGWLQNLIPRGLHPVVVSPITGEFQEWVESQGGAFYRLDLPFPSKTRMWPFARSLWQLRRIVRRHRIDVIHCNEQDVYPIAGWLARLCRVPVIVSVHFTMDRGFCQWAFGKIHTPDRMLFISRGNVEACRAAVQGIIPENRWLLLPNGLDLRHYRPDDERRRRFRAEHGLTDEVAIGVACAIRPRKQLEHLFEAAGRDVGVPVRLFVAGGPVPGDEDYARALLDGARARLGNRLVLLGYLEELRNLLNGLDVFVNTSQEEACSISILEALACGCPVLGYPSKSVDEQVLPQGGEMVPQDDVERLTASLRQWVSDSGGLAARRAGARQRVQESYDIAALSEQLWREYETMRARTPITARQRSLA